MSAWLHIAFPQFTVTMANLARVLCLTTPSKQRRESNSSSHDACYGRRTCPRTNPSTITVLNATDLSHKTGKTLVAAVVMTLPLQLHAMQTGSHPLQFVIHHLELRAMASAVDVRGLPCMDDLDLATATSFDHPHPSRCNERACHHEHERPTGAGP